MGDTGNWEFAAAVAAICIGLGGLLLFTVLGAIGGWRMCQASVGASVEVAEAARSMQTLARAMIVSRDEAPAAPPDLAAHAEELATLRSQTADLLEKQELLQDAVRNLIESGVLQGEESIRLVTDVGETLRRVEEQLGRIAGTAPRRPEA